MKVKLLKTFSWGALAISTVALPVIFSISANSQRIIYQNQIYQSLDEAVNAYLRENATGIKTRTVVGSTTEATIDNKYKFLNKSRLPDFDPISIKPAYIMQNGNLNIDPVKAASSQASIANAVTQYTYPGAFESYLLKTDAEAARDAAMQSQTLAIVRLNNPQPNTAMPTLYVNPTNKGDVTNLTNNLKNALLANNKAALREVESSYVAPNTSANLGSGWTLQPFFKDSSTAKLNLIDDVIGSGSGSELDFSRLAVQEAWIKKALPDNFLTNFKTPMAANVGIDFSRGYPLLYGTMSLPFWQGSDNAFDQYSYTSDRIVFDAYEFWPGDYVINASYKILDGSGGFINYEFDEPKNHIRDNGWITVTNRVSPLKGEADLIFPFKASSELKQYFTFNDLLQKNPDYQAAVFSKYEIYPIRAKTPISAKAAFGQGLSMALNSFVNELKDQDKTLPKINLAKLFGRSLEGYAASGDGGFLHASVNPGSVSKFNFNDSTFSYVQHIQRSGEYDILHTMTPLQVNNVKFEVALDSLFNRDLSGDELYKIRLEIAKRADKLVYIASYQGLPLFKVNESANSVISLEPLPEAQLSGKILTQQTPNVSGPLLASVKSLMTSIDAAATPNSKITTLMAANDIEIQATTLLQNNARAKSADFSFNNERIEPYLQYLVAFKNLMRQISASSGSDEEVTARKVAFWQDEYFDFKNYSSFKNIDYFDNIVTRNSFNRPVYGPKLDLTLTPFRLSLAEFKTAKERVKKWFTPPISTIFTFYDADGLPLALKKSTSIFDNSSYDSLTLKRENILREYPVKISKDYFFVADSLGVYAPYRTQVSTIYEFRVGTQLLYFANFDDLRRYVSDEIASKSVRLEG